MARTDAQIIETFHLAFLTALPARIGRDRFVLKGGANLRYFFDSLRYSEDIDLDVDTSLASNLEAKIDTVLAAPQIGLLLRSARITIDVAGVGKPKQTPTTRRWKIPLLAAERGGAPVRTKVECSARPRAETRHESTAVPSRIVAPYGLAAPIVPHYVGAAALEQKVGALAGRSETQARDVFDLELLMRSFTLTPGAVDAAVGRQAAERCFELDFLAFEDQILPFLEPAAAELYDAGAWEQMQITVAERILASIGDGHDADD